MLCNLASNGELQHMVEQNLGGRQNGMGIADILSSYDRGPFSPTLIMRGETKFHINLYSTVRPCIHFTKLCRVKRNQAYLNTVMHGGERPVPPHLCTWCSSFVGHSWHLSSRWAAAATAAAAKKQFGERRARASSANFYSFRREKHPTLSLSPSLRFRFQISHHHSSWAFKALSLFCWLKFFDRSTYRRVQKYCRHYLLPAYDCGSSSVVLVIDCFYSYT